MLATICMLTAMCASSAETPPLPIWRTSYAKATYRIPGGRTAFLTADYANLVLILENSTGKRTIKTVSLNKDIEPTTEVSVARVGGGQYHYSYTVRNDASAHDPILRFWIVIPRNFDSSFALVNGRIGPKEWGGSISYPVIAKQCELKAGTYGRYAAWVGTSGMKYVIAPGQSRSGLGLKTAFRPGFTTAYVGGPFIALPEEYDVDLQITADPIWTMAHMPVIGPVFDRKASCNEILANYHQGLTRLLQCGLLRDPERRAMSALLTKIDEHSGACSALLTDLQAASSNEPDSYSAVLNALRLALQ